MKLRHSCVLFQVVHFQIVPIDPLVSLNKMFLAAPDYQPSLHGNSHREGYEPVGEGDGEGEGEGEGTVSARRKLQVDSVGEFTFAGTCTVMCGCQGCSRQLSFLGKWLTGLNACLLASLALVKGQRSN